MAAKENENGMTGFPFRTTVHRSKWESFRYAIYNPSTKEILGRTAKNWGQLLIFYSIFYAILAALFAICMQGLMATLDDRQPRWTLEHSIIGTSPGLGFRPISARTEEGSLIWYDQKNETSIKKWVDLIDEFLEPYARDTTGKNVDKCDYNKPPSKDHVCEVNLSQFGDCSKQNSYGYNSSSPCVFLKLNKIFGWEPEYYTNATKDMEEYDKDLVTVIATNGSNQQVWVSCRGEKPSDRENALGFNYFPRGFPSYYFPYTNADNYLSPLVAVQVITPAPNVIVNIECRAWAKNIIYRGGERDRQGSIHFEILRD